MSIKVIPKQKRRIFFPSSLESELKATQKDSGLHRILYWNAYIDTIQLEATTSSSVLNGHLMLGFTKCLSIKVSLPGPTKTKNTVRGKYFFFLAICCNIELNTQVFLMSSKRIYVIFLGTAFPLL